LGDPGSYGLLTLQRLLKQGVMKVKLELNWRVICCLLGCGMIDLKNSVNMLSAISEPEVYFTLKAKACSYETSKYIFIYIYICVCAYIYIYIYQYNGITSYKTIGMVILL
jgi:hypothetical protein